MAKQEKSSGFQQGIYQVSSVKKHPIGMIRTLHDGTTFRYAHNGATGLVAGKMCAFTAVNAGWVLQACPAAAVGSSILTLTVTAGGTLIENELEGGRLIIATSALVGTPGATGPHGYTLMIDSNSALAGGGTSLVVTLVDPLPVALTALNYFTITPSPWYRTVVSPAATSRIVSGHIPVGLPLIDVAANYYFWILTKGLGGARLRVRKAALAVMTLAASYPLVPSISAGFLTQGITNAVTAYPSNQTVVGRYMGLANTVSANTYKAYPIMLDIEQ